MQHQGKLSTRFGSGATLLGAACFVAIALLAPMFDNIAITVAALLVLSAAYFTLHSAAVGQGRGRSNALYIMFYYLGGSLGIQLGGYIYQWGGWQKLMLFCLALLTVPLCTAVYEIRRHR